MHSQKSFFNQNLTKIEWLILNLRVYYRKQKIKENSKTAPSQKINILDYIDYHEQKEINYREILTKYFGYVKLLN